VVVRATGTYVLRVFVHFGRGCRAAKLDVRANRIENTAKSTRINAGGLVYIRANHMTGMSLARPQRHPASEALRLRW
jgi:hypothetical protein